MNRCVKLIRDYDFIPESIRNAFFISISALYGEKLSPDYKKIFMEDEFMKRYGDQSLSSEIAKRMKAEENLIKKSVALERMRARVNRLRANAARSHLMAEKAGINAEKALNEERAKAEKALNEVRAKTENARAKVALYLLNKGTRRQEIFDLAVSRKVYHRNDFSAKSLFLKDLIGLSLWALGLVSKKDFWANFVVDELI
ncbi:MAG: hypothetical protein LBF41_04105, partial [Deltaproteobacteria bacterium]|nr:hypothetical protein [Deltaproteobacteria bacterium]